MAHKALTLALGAGLAVTAAGSKKPEELPPPPPTTTQPPAPAPEAPVSITTVPGSMADFMEKAGSDRVFFALDSYELDSAATATLDSQAAWLTQYPQVRITVEGHADERGTPAYNLPLGARRATAAQTQLPSKRPERRRVRKKWG